MKCVQTTVTCLVGLFLLLAGCDPADGFRDHQCSAPAPVVGPTVTEAATPYTISDSAWDETAVRQVLHAFAFGGFATDTQIKAWAKMPPTEAISEIISFETVNAKLSPPASDTPPIAPENGTLFCLSSLFSTTAGDNPIPADRRKNFEIDAWDSHAQTFIMASRIRGLNPVRQRIGLLETNYHMSVNANAGVTNRQIYTYYDQIMNALAAGAPYHEVLSGAAISAAIARQYNHRNNVYRDGKFSGNEDFGREFHQLFFGILGAYDDDYTGEDSDIHERVTIPHTARALTDMPIHKDKERSDEITYGREEHWQGELSILETPNHGATVKERFDALGAVAIAHEESIDNLPVILIRFLADDLLDPDSADPLVQERVHIVREIWAGMKTKNLLEFLRKYAISTAFHNPSRVKYWTSIERNLLIENLLTLGNAEVYQNLYNARTWMGREDVSVFRPAHDVFGGQTGLEAAGTADVFRVAYNRAVESSWSITRVEDDSWLKDWAQVIPRGEGERFRVRKTAEWLWQRFVADDLAHFGTLERAHVYALLASGTDLAYWLDEATPDAVYSLEQLESQGPIHDQVVGAELAFIHLDSSDAKERRDANYRVSLAVNFIITTPWFMAQQGR